jgi:GNAT superfamily N-acetyltransferase
VSPISIRASRGDDRAFILATAERLASFGPPAWRTAAEIVGSEVRSLEGYFLDPEPGSSLLVAEAGERLLGFVYLQRVQDYFTLEHHGHVGILAVTDEAEGQGAGKALLQAAEAWARERGYRKLTLSVFEDNHRARRIYERAGFRPDTIKYLKVL